MSRASAAKQEDGRQRGFALLAVLLFLAVMLAAAMGTSFLSRVQMRGAFYLEEKEQAYYLARAGLARAVEDISRYWAAQTPWMAPADGQWVYWKPERNARFLVLNEQGKLNLNRLRPSIFLRALLASGMAPDEARELRDAVLDWVDRNDLARANGAESQYYQSLSPPYLPRNGPIQCPGELMSIRGVDSGMLFGLMAEGGQTSAPVGLPLGLWSLFTVYTRSSRLDVNSAGLAALMSLPGMNQPLAERIITQRKQARFYRLDEVRRLLGDQTFRLVAPLLTVAPSQVYTVISEAWLPGGKARHAMLGVLTIRDAEQVDYQYWVDDLFYGWPQREGDSHAGDG